MEKTDVIIVGAGPVGLFTVFQCGMMRLKCHVIDPLEVPGGQCSALYPEKPIYDVPGFPSVSGQALIDNLMAQITPFHPSFRLGHTATHLRAAEGGFVMETDKGVQVHAPAMVIAAGSGAFGPNRPPLEGLQAFEGKSIFYHVQRPDGFVGKKVVIAGGGDSAVDWALLLAEKGAQVTVVHRRAKFRANPDNEAKLKAWAEAGKLSLCIPYQLHALEGNVDTGSLSTVVVRDLSGETVALAADVLLPFFGLSTDLGPLADWGLNFQDHRLVVEPSTCATNVPGIYGVGDMVTYPNKLKLILTGFAEAAHAAHAIRAQLFPDQHFHFEHSTTSGVQPL